jgi:hypothetical protein
VRIGNSYPDTMGFTVAGPNHFGSFNESAVLELHAGADHADQVAVQSAHRLRRLLPMAALIIEGWEPRRSRCGLEVLIDLNLGGAAGEALWLRNFLSIHQPPWDTHNVSGRCLRRTAHSGASARVDRSLAAMVCAAR